VTLADLWTEHQTTRSPVHGPGKRLGVATAMQQPWRRSLLLTTYVGTLLAGARAQ